MPLYRYQCPACGVLVSRIRTSSKCNDPFDCGACGTEVERAPTGPSMQAVERLDNGIMARPVERLADAARIYKERADADTRACKAKRVIGTT